MATMPSYTRRIEPTLPGAPVRAIADTSVGAGLNDVGNSVARIGDAIDRQNQKANRDAALLNDAMQRKLTEDAHAWTASALSNDHVQWSERLSKMQEEAPPGAPNFTANFVKEFDSTTDESLSNAPDEQAKRFYAERRLALRTSLALQAQSFEAQQGVKWRDQQWDDSITNVERVAASNPDQAKMMSAELTALLRASPNQAHAQLKIAKLRDAVAKSASQGLIQRNPELALRTLDSYFGVETVLPSDTAPMPSAGGPDWAELSRAQADAAASPARMATLEAEANDPNLSADARAAVQREIKRVKDQLAKGPPARAATVVKLPQVDPPPLKDGKPQSGQWFVDTLDPQTAWTLRNAAQAEVNRIYAAKRGQQADNERIAGAQVKSVVDMMKDGYAPDATTLATTRTLARGTQYEQALSEAEQDFTVTSAFRVMPSDERRAVLDGFRAQGNAQQWSPRRAAMFDTLNNLNAKIEQQYKDEPLRAGATQGLYTGLAPLDTTTLDTVSSGLATRSQQALAVQTRTGKPVSPLTSDEVSRVADMLTALPADQHARQVAAITDRMTPEQGQALATQLDRKDRALSLEIAAASSKTASGKYVSEWIARGAQSVRDKTIKEDSTAMTGLRAQLAAEVGDALSGKAREDVIDAARLAYLGQQAAGISPSAQGVVALVLGGPLVEHNGKRIPVPQGIDREGLLDRLRRMPVSVISGQAPDGFVYSTSGRPLGVPEFLAELPQAQLEPAGYGRYMVRSGAGIAVNQHGAPILLQVP